MVLGVGSEAVRMYSCLHVGLYYEFSHHLKRLWCGPSVDRRSGALILLGLGVGSVIAGY